MRSRFKPIQNYRQNCNFVYHNFFKFLESRREERMVASITRDQSALHFPHNFRFVNYFLRYLNFATLAKDLLSYFHAMILFYILTMTHQHILRSPSLFLVQISYRRVLRLLWVGLSFQQGKRHFSLLDRVQTGYRIHPVSYLICTRLPFLCGKATETCS